MKIALYLLVFFTMQSLFTTSRAYGQITKEPDYSSYNIARQYQKDKNFLLSYKYLIIFKYVNLERLQKSVNQNALIQLDNQIGQLENYLSEKEALIDIKNARGFTDHQLDSLFKVQKKELIFKEIKLD
jgi:hypothetical protein